MLLLRRFQLLPTYTGSQLLGRSAGSELNCSPKRQILRDERATAGRFTHLTLEQNRAFVYTCGEITAPNPGEGPLNQDLLAAARSFDPARKTHVRCMPRE